jgi:hypothetical protein
LRHLAVLAGSPCSLPDHLFEKRSHAIEGQEAAPARLRTRRAFDFIRDSA